MRQLPEHIVIERASRGDERALRRILEEHHALIYSAVYDVLRNRAEAEDAVQGVFIRIYRGLPEFRGSSRLSTWIYRVARNEALNALAKRRTDCVPLDECADLRSPAAAPDEKLAGGDAAELLDRAMERLDEPQRIALELRYRAEKSYEEIADIMDLPIGTVRTHLHRGKINLRRMLARGAAGVPVKGSDDV